MVSVAEVRHNARLQLMRPFSTMRIGTKEVLVGAAGIALLVLFASVWGAHQIVRSKIVSAAEARGIELSVGSVGFRPSGLVLGDLRGEGLDGALMVEADDVRLSLAWSRALTGAGARRSLTGIEIQGGRAQVRLRPGLRQSFGRQSSETATAPGAEEPPNEPFPPVTAVDLDVAAVDEHGVFAQLQAAELELRAGNLSLRADTVRGLEGGAEEIELRNLTFEADVVRRVVSRATVAGGQVVLNPRGETGPAWRSRISQALAAVRGNASEEVESDEQELGWTRRLTSDASLEVRSLNVRSEDERSAPVLQSLDLRLKRTAPDRFEAVGRGRVSDGGNLSWNLQLSPAALRGEGEVRFSGLPLALCTPFLPRFPWYETDVSRLDGVLEIHGSGPADPVTFRGHVAARNVAFDSPRLAPTPVRNIDFEVRGSGAWYPVSRRLHLDTAELNLGEVGTQIEGDFRWDSEGFAIEAKATLPATSCEAAVGAIPGDLLGELRSFSLDGLMSGKIDVALDTSALEDTTLDIDITNGCRFRSVPAVADLSRFQGPFEHRVLEPDGEWFEMTTGPGSGNWVGIFSISPFLIHAVVAHEDASFFRHSGFAPWAIRDALVRNLQEGRYVYGASTITMQLAKNLFLHREKTIARKVQEAILTWWLESSLEKQEILELYFNVIEYGPAIYGLRQAAWHFFGRDPSLLSPAEGAYLATILPGPKSFYSHYTRGTLSASMRSRIARFLEHMKNRERIDEAALAFGLGELEQFGFRRPDEGRAPLRFVEGSAAALPFEVQWETFDASEEASWEEWVDDLPLPDSGTSG